MVLTGQGARVDTTTASGRLGFGIFAAPAAFERELISERTIAGLPAARARDRKGSRKFALTKGPGSSRSGSHVKPRHFGRGTLQGTPYQTRDAVQICRT